MALWKARGRGSLNKNSKFRWKARGVKIQNLEHGIVEGREGCARVGYGRYWRRKWSVWGASDQAAQLSQKPFFKCCVWSVWEWERKWVIFFGRRPVPFGGSRLTRLPRHNRSPVAGGNRSAARFPPASGQLSRHGRETRIIPPLDEMGYVRESECEWEWKSEWCEWERMSEWWWKWVKVNEVRVWMSEWCEWK